MMYRLHDNLYRYTGTLFKGHRTHAYTQALHPNQPINRGKGGGP